MTSMTRHERIRSSRWRFVTANNFRASFWRPNAEFLASWHTAGCSIHRGETLALPSSLHTTTNQTKRARFFVAVPAAASSLASSGPPRALTRPSAPSAVQEFDAQLKKMMDGDVTLVSSLGQVKLALEAAIKSAFQTPEVIRMFAKREPAALRARLAKLQEDHKLGRLPTAAFRTNAVEVLVALKKLGEEVRRGFVFCVGLCHYSPRRLYASFYGTIARHQ